MESELGVGSVFTVSLPLLHAAAPEVKTVVSSTAVLSGEHGCLHVLVAEDHPANRALLHDQLSVLGCHAEIVENGLLALRAFSEGEFDVVLTDLNMPVMDGYALASCLRDQHAMVPVIGMTAHATADEYQRSQESGIVDLLLKPLLLADIHEMLCTHCVVDIAERPLPVTPSHREELAPHVRISLEVVTAQALRDIRQALAQEDSARVQTQLHLMKGGLALAGLEDLVVQCTELEYKAREGDLVAVRAVWDVLERTVRDALGLSS